MKKIKKKVSPPKNISPAEKVKRIKIKVVGLGGGGCSIVSDISQRIRGNISFLALDSDLRSLRNIAKRIRKVPIGQKLTRGLGGGMDPQIGENIIVQEKEKIVSLLKDADLLLFVVSLGGGVGSGALPPLAKIGRDLGKLTYAIFTLPFNFEGEKKKELAWQSIFKARRKLNAFSIIPNEMIFQSVEKTTPLREALSIINKNLSRSLGNLVSIIYKAGLINIDFADFKTIFQGEGKLSYLTSLDFSRFSEKEKKELLSSSLYPYSIEGASSILFDIQVSPKVSLGEVNEVSRSIFQAAQKKAKIIFGLSPKKGGGSRLTVTLLATGCNKDFLNKFSALPREELGVKQEERKERKRNVPKKKKKVSQRKKKVIPKEVVKKEEDKTTVRKNALQLKKEIEEEEKKILAQEKLWEKPPFLTKS